MLRSVDERVIAVRGPAGTDEAGTPGIRPAAAERVGTGSGERLGARLARGAVVEVAGFGAGQILRLGGNLVLARLLFPEAFGLMAILSLLVYGLGMMSDVGLHHAVIRSPRGEEAVFLDTTWTLKVLRGLGLWIAASLLAWPVALAFRQPELALMIPLGSASTFFQGLYSMRLLVLRRHLRPVPIAILEVSTQGLGIVAMILLAWAGLGAWALVWGSVVGAAAHAGFSYALPGTHRQRFRWDPGVRREVMHFGRWIFASSAVTFAASRGDLAVLGRLVGAASLGVYNIALALAELPAAVAGRVVEGMLYPSYARVHNERPGDLLRVYYRSRLVLDSLAHTALGGLVALSPWLIGVLYDDRYRDAAPMLQILAIRTSLTVLAAPCQSVLFAKGESVHAFRRNAAVAICTFVAMPVGHALGGTLGLLWGTVAARAAALPMLWPAASRAGLLRLGRELLFLPLLAAGYGAGRALAALLG